MRHSAEANFGSRHGEVKPVLITELFRAKALLSTQREATRLLETIIVSLDVVPSSDGSVQFTFRGDVEFLDRLAVWNASVEDDEDFSDQEADNRDLDRPGSAVNEVAIEAAHRQRRHEAKPLAA